VVTGKLDVRAARLPEEAVRDLTDDSSDLDVDAAEEEATA